MEKQEEVQQIATNEPDMDYLEGRFAQVVDDQTEFVEQCERNYKTRRAMWDGQNEDGKKGKNNDVPWPKSSDKQVFAVDDIINGNVALRKTAVRKSIIQAVPTEGNDIARAKTVSNFVKWLVRSQIPHLAREEELLAQYVEEMGIGAAGIFWETRMQLLDQVISVSDMPEDMVQMLAEKENDAIMAEQIIAAFPDVGKKRAKEVVKELRDKGESTISVAKQVVNRPIIRAYALDSELMVPTSVTDLESATDLYEIRYYSADQLREKVITEDWDEDWVDMVIEKTMDDPKGDPETNAIEKNTISRSGFSIQENMDGLARVVYAYQRLSDDNGVPGIYRTVFAPAVEGYGLFGLFPYGKFPFVIFKREYMGRRMHDSRGIPELGKPTQDVLKAITDGTIDNMSISVIPPRHHPPGRQQPNMGPGADIPMRRPGEFGFVERPPYPGVSFEVEDRLYKRFYQQFGRPTDESDKNSARAIQSDMVETWLRNWVDVYNQVFDLYGKYGDDEQYFRVIGSVNSKPELMKKPGPEEKYDFYLSYDVLLSEPEEMKNQIEAIIQLAQVADRDGVTRWTELYQAALEMINPILGERIVEPKESATAREIEEENEAVAKIVAGVDEDIKLGGAHEMRIQVLEKWFQSQAGQMLMKNEQTPWVKELLEKRYKQHQMQVTQQENAKIGKYGA